MRLTEDAIIQLTALCHDNPFKIPNRERYIAHGIELALTRAGFDKDQTEVFAKIRSSFDPIF